ncbi:NAD-dependent epimerase/dehydratase family protein [Duganella sp. BJB488]|uniref:NAD-dependent epimerase/dehydratase family protein n=1 Tax=unclassified Duganella TaxID=2636909 RepID=UPI000E357655|nr:MULTISPECIES: NAD(P)H-binding protein [unclassified Duganella]NVD72451.1 NAD(P)H-binding protein [Duganella sp. BJB1802]RFP11072.1 NAD-dependent epimerase/dehydratase family protein [Duganella sp. BJB489]RFP14380.1 NAD-dependent epimerase/dehydratase family protein [Duganella sp. BJB488]RFP30315.1 NAD-dependent epimerase/dehydratase family protein [Duganella sp. BJB480]
MKKTALVLGATGGIGGEVARLLVARGWNVKALHRAPERAAKPNDGIQWLAGDAMNRDEVVNAAHGVQLIVHAVNPPGYRNWGALVLPMIDNTIAAARASGARILLPGTVYNYGPDAFPILDEESPQRPVTRKGAIRVEMEARLQAAAADGVRTLIVRAGDFFGPKAGNSWFAQGLVKPGKPLTAISYPGSAGVGHQWAYLPDVAETMVQLVEKEDRLATFARFQMEGHWDADGTQMVAAIARAARKPELKASAFPWWLLALASPFVTVFRELREMRYLWQQPVQMSNKRLVRMLGAEPRTPLDVAVQRTLSGLGSI